MADTALTLITDALLDLGVLADEEAPTASQGVGGLRKLNNLIDSLNIESLSVYGAASHTLPLVANQGVYTIGTGGNLNISRPSLITSAYIRDTSQPVANQLDYPLYIYNNQEWADVAFKGITASWPNWGIWFDDSYPLINAYVNPIPTSSQYSVVIWVDGAIGSLTLNQVINLAPGYKRMLTSNLAIELAPSYGVQVPEAVIKIAQDSKANLKIKNFQLNELTLDPRLGGGWFDITTRQYR